MDVPSATPGVSGTPPAPPGRIALPGGQPPPSARTDAFPALLLGASGVGLPLATPVVSSTPPAPPGRTAALGGQPFQMVGRRDGLPASPPGSSGVNMPLSTRGVSPTPDVSPAPPALRGRDAALGGQPLQPAGRRDARPAPTVSGTGNGVSPSTPVPTVGGTGVGVPPTTAPLAPSGGVPVRASSSLLRGPPAASSPPDVRPGPSGPLPQLAALASLPVVTSAGSALLPPVGRSVPPSPRAGLASGVPLRPRGGVAALRTRPGGSTPTGGTLTAGRGGVGLLARAGTAHRAARGPFAGAAAPAPVVACAAAVTSSSALPPLSTSPSGASARTTDLAAEEPAEEVAETSGVPETLVRHFAALHRRLDSQDAAMVVLSATARGIKETGGQCFDKVESLAASFDAVVRASRTDMAVLTEQVKKLSERGGVPAASSDAVTPQTQSGAAGTAGQVAGTQRGGKEVVPLAPWGAAIQVGGHASMREWLRVDRSSGHDAVTNVPTDPHAPGCGPDLSRFLSVCLTSGLVTVARGEQDKITEEYIKQWASGRTKDEVFPSNYDVTSIMAGVCQRNFKVDRASANRITMSKFTFPSRINPLVTADEYFTTYMKRNIATWHSKCKDLLFEAYLKRLVVDGEYGCTVIKQGKRTVALSAAQAIELLTNDSFYTLDSCFTAFVSSIFSFVVTVPNGDRLIVPRSATVPEAFVRLLNAHLGWFILKVS